MKYGKLGVNGLVGSKQHYKAPTTAVSPSRPLASYRRSAGGANSPVTGGLGARLA